MLGTGADLALVIEQAVTEPLDCSLGLYWRTGRNAANRAEPTRRLTGKTLFTGGSSLRSQPDPRLAWPAGISGELVRPCLRGHGNRRSF